MSVVMNTIFFLCGMVAVAFVLIISVYLVISGLPAILEIGPINFLFGTRWYASTEDFGIFAIILTSISLVVNIAVLALTFWSGAGFLGAVPWGLGAGGGAAAGFGCACSSSLRHSGMCAEALQSRSLDDSGCLE